MQKKDNDQLCLIQKLLFISTIGLLLALSGCATTNDPKQGGFFSNLNALFTGSYEEHMHTKQQELEEARNAQKELKKEAVQSADNAVFYTEELEKTEKRLAVLHNQLAELDRRIDDASKAEKINADEHEHLKNEINVLQKLTEQISEQPSTLNEENKARLIEMENRKQELENALEAALLF